MKLRWSSFFITIFSFSICWGTSVENVTYNGRLISPNGSPLEAGSVVFTMKILDPTENCVLYKENQTLNMAGSNGAFSLVIGEGTRTDGGTQTLKQVFTNAGTLAGLTCVTGTAYAAASTDDRKLSVTFNDGIATQTLTSIAIKSVPFALQASQVTGYGINNLAKISGTGNVGVLSPGQYSQILAFPSSACALNEILKWNGTAWLCAADALGAAGGLGSLNGATGSTQTFAIGSAGTAPLFSTASNAHTLNIPFANTASVTAGLISKSEFDIFNSKMASVTAGTGLNVGAGPGGVISATGTLNLANTSVIAGTYGSASSVGNFTVDAQGRLTAAASTAISLDTAAITTGTLPILRGGTNSATPLNNNRLIVSSAGALVEGAALTDGQLILGSTGLAPSVATMSGDSTITKVGVVTVGKIQGRTVSNLAPVHGQILRWNANLAQWEPSTQDIVAFKTVTQSVANSVVLTNDTDFSFTALPNTNYYFDLFLRIQGATGSNFQFQWSLPSGSWQASGGRTNMTTPGYFNNAPGAITTANGTIYIVELKGILQLGVTGGLVNFQWAQSSTSATPAQVMQGSSMSVKPY